MSVPPTVVSFYAGDPVYTEYASRLEKSCVEHGVEHLIVPLTTQVTDWVELTNLKARFILATMLQLQKPLLWIDADGMLMTRPTLLDDCEADFAVYAKPRPNPWQPIGRERMHLPTKWPAKLGSKWFLSGTVFFNSTAGGVTILHRWASMAREDSRAYEQYQLQEAWCDTRPNTLWLPEKYCQVRRTKPDTVIRHDLASTKLKVKAVRR